MSQLQETIWIVHDDPGLRDALARVLTPAPVVPGPPELGAFVGAREPAGVILLVPDRTEALERALQFAYEATRRHAELPFVVAHGDAIEEGTIGELFAGLRVACVRLPPDRYEILDALAELQQTPWPDPIGARRHREALLARATERLGGIGLEPIQLARRHAVLIRGGAGTGRLLLARTIHALAEEPSAFVHIACGPETDPDALHDRIGRALHATRDDPVTFCLDGIDALPEGTQRELCGTIELGVPGTDPARLRWLGLARRPLARALRRAFADATIELPGPFEGGPALRAEPLETPEPAPAPPPTAAGTADEAVMPPPLDAAAPPPATDLGRVALSLAHELRNPLVPVQMLATLGAQGGDPDHERLREQVQIGIDRIERVLERLTAFSTVVDAAASRKRVDLSRLLERLLQDRRTRIQDRRLLVMRHLESEAPEAIGSEEALGFAFEALLDAVMDGSRERGDLYIASRHHPTGLRGGPAMRVLLRFHGGTIPSGATSAAARDVDPYRNSLDWILAEEMVHHLEGTVAIDASDSGENVVAVYLPAPPR